MPVTLYDRVVVEAVPTETEYFVERLTRFTELFWSTVAETRRTAVDEFEGGRRDLLQMSLCPKRVATLQSGGGVV